MPLGLVLRLQIEFWIQIYRSQSYVKIFEASPIKRDTYTKICEVHEFALKYWFYKVCKPQSLGGFQNPNIITDRGGGGIFCRERKVST